MTGEPLMSSPLRANEGDRLAALRALEILGSEPEPALDAICRTAQRLFGVPITLVSLVDEDKQWFKARCGLDVEETPRDVSFCAHAVLDDDVFVVEDATRDPRFSRNPLVTGPLGLRFYAGAPIALAPGLPLGTLCLIDRQPRSFSQDDREALADLARVVVAQIRLHEARNMGRRQVRVRRAREALIARQRRELEERKTLLRVALENIEQGILMFDKNGRVQVYNSRFTELLDLPEALLAAHPTIDEIIDFQLDCGDYPDADADQLATARSIGFCGNKGRFERRRRDGTILDVHATPLADGGSVRTFTDITAAKRVERALRDNEERLSLALDTGRDGVWDVDLVTGERVVRGRCYGSLAVPETSTRLSDFLDIVHPEDRRRVAALLEGHLSGETDVFCAEYRVALRTGGWLWIMDRGRVVSRASDGTPLRILGTQTDIDDRKQAEAKLRLESERLALALDASGLASWDLDSTTGKLVTSESWSKIYGLDPLPCDANLRAWTDLIHPDDLDRAQKTAQAHLRGETDLLQNEYRIRHPALGWRWIVSRGRVVDRDAEEKPSRMIGVHADITERKQAEENTARLARHDTLTGLPNRLHLDETLASLPKAAEIAVLCIDLDRFKPINDTYGHAIGDEVLREVARRLREVVRGSDLVARLGGDEFAILQCGADQPRGARSLAGRVIDVLSQPMHIEGLCINLGASVGIAVGTSCSASRALLLKADVALYRAKAEERNAMRLYEPEMDAAAEERRRLEIDLRGALSRGEIHLHGQPILDLHRGEIGVVEALVRWRHPERGAISPADFVPIAEQTGLIDTLGEWVLREACAQAARWPEEIRVAVNVSPLQLRRNTFIEQVIGALAAAGLAPHRLELEVTETALMQDARGGFDVLDRLRSLGVRIALDDFGTGYSSLSYLSRFDFDKIKIDRSFIRGIAEARTQGIVRAVVDLAARGGSIVTAEGIETPEQLEIVSACGCAEAQGFLLSRPIPIAEVLAIVKTTSSASARPRARSTRRSVA